MNPATSEPISPVNRGQSADVRWLRSDEMSRWDRFVLDHSQGLIYHSTLWKNALENAFPHVKGHFLAETEPETGKIKSGIALYTVSSWLLGPRLISIPFATLGEPLVETAE